MKTKVCIECKLEKPLSSAKTEEELYKLCHYTNLHPLWVEENLKKSNKIVEQIKNKK